MVKLANGSDWPEQDVVAVKDVFDALFFQTGKEPHQSITDSGAIAHLIRRVRGENPYRLHAAERAKLQVYGLLEADNSIKPIVRDFVESYTYPNTPTRVTLTPLAKPDLTRETQVYTDVDVPALREYYARVKTVASHVRAVMENSGCDLLGHVMASESPNPYHRRIPFNGGLALVCSSGLPSYLMTPLGRQDVTRGMRVGNGKNVMSALKRTLGLQETLLWGDHENHMIDHDGPFYRVLKDVDGKPFAPAMIVGQTSHGGGYKLSPGQYEQERDLWEQIDPWKPTRRAPKLKSKPAADPS